jgi:hypothetical protein
MSGPRSGLPRDGWCVRPWPWLASKASITLAAWVPLAHSTQTPPEQTLQMGCPSLMTISRVMVMAAALVPQVAVSS